MIIYLEGPDGSGKSTLADNIAELCETLKVPYNRFAEQEISTNPTKPNRIDKVTLFSRLEAMSTSQKIHILDRGPISDNIYRMFDNYEALGKLEDYLKLFKSFREKILIIYCRTAKAEEAMLARGDDNPVAIRKHKELTKAYDLIMSAILYTLPANVVKFDFTIENETTNTLKLVEHFINMQEWKNDVYDNN